MNHISAKQLANVCAMARAGLSLVAQNTQNTPGAIAEAAHDLDAVVSFQAFLADQERKNIAAAQPPERPNPETSNG